MKLDNNIYLPQKLPPKNRQPSFKAKSSVLRDADWVCRSVNKIFPTLSSTWLNYNLHIEQGNKLKCIEIIGEKIHNARCNNNSELVPFNFFKKMLEQVKKEHVGNCYEKASIAELILRVNGVDNCDRINFVTNDGKKNLHHTALLVNLDKNNYCPSLQKLIIIDPWVETSGFADTVFKKYTNLYNNFFKLKDNECIQFVKRHSLDLLEEDIKFFRENYPELLFKSSDKHKLFTKA